MKRKFIVSLIIFATSMSVYSQIRNGTIAVAVSGNYYDGSSLSGVTTNSLTTKAQNIDAGISIEYFVKSNVSIGVALDYGWGKEDRVNSFSSNTFSQKEFVNVKSTLILPSLIGGYYLQVMDRLSLNMNVKLSYGSCSINSHADYLWIQQNDDWTHLQTGAINEFISWDTDNNYSYFGSSLSPEINYFFSEKIGLCLKLGGIEYGILDWDKYQSSWNVNFNPNFWRLGVKFVM
jgi:hypothetical protein